MSNQDQSEFLTCSAESGGSPLPQKSPTLWPTAKATDGNKPSYGDKNHQGLPVHVKMWQTPNVEDAAREGSAEAWQQWEREGRTTQCRLRNQIHGSFHSPTPRSNPSPAPSITATFPIRSALAPSRTSRVIRSLSEQVLSRMLYAGASRASRTVAPESDSPAQTTATSGESVGVFLGTFDPDSRCSRTSAACLQASQDFFSTAYLATWPRFGTLVNGRLYLLPPLALHTAETESGCSAGMSWLTPSANEDAAGTVNGKMQTMLSHQVQGRFSGPPSPANGPAYRESRSTTGSRQGLWATPRKSDVAANMSMKNCALRVEKSGYHGNIEEQVAMEHRTGKLNPHWVFALMGYPPLWAELGRKFTTASRNSKQQATPSSQK